MYAFVVFTAQSCSIRPVNYSNKLTMTGSHFPQIQEQQVPLVSAAIRLPINQYTPQSGLTSHKQHLIG